MEKSGKPLPQSLQDNARTSLIVIFVFVTAYSVGASVESVGASVEGVGASVKSHGKSMEQSGKPLPH